ncbi:MAG: ABC transporter permease [Deltaproteobacteria bacterium]|nr:ABC transporter permease [Deltaproteobacteria bacterium]MCW5804320.1 ABC transporter permease [Deltaproteobacteria bacterium]
MMPVGKLARMVVANTARSPRHFILSAFGIVIGIGAFVLFLALTQRAGMVIEKVFPLDEVQVVAPRVSVGGAEAEQKVLDDETVKTILGREEVASAVPRMSLAFPAAGRGDFQGTDLKFEVGGFSDGVAGDYVQDDARIRALFRDWDALEDDDNRVECIPPSEDPDEDIIQSPPAPPKEKKVGANDKWRDNGWGLLIPNEAPPPPPKKKEDTSSIFDEDGGPSDAYDSWMGKVIGKAIPRPLPTYDNWFAQYAMKAAARRKGKPPPSKEKKEPSYFNPCPNPDRYYCDEAERRCKHRVPIVLSSTVVELYNNQFSKAHNMQSADTQFVHNLIQQKGLSAMRFSIGLGFTTVAGSTAATNVPPRRVEAVVIGVSKRAMPVGVTFPIDYIKRWNLEFVGEDAASSYSSIIVTLKDRNQLAVFGQWIKDQGLRLEDSLGERFATVIFVIRLLFLIISVAILVIAVINIGHNFFIQVSERRREIGIMRAVGATELDVQLIVLGEAALIGIVGGLLGIALAFGIGTGWNAYSEASVPNFPFKPTSWFEWRTWIWASALTFSTLFCVLGGFLPARRAAKMEPAQALVQN